MSETENKPETYYHYCPSFDTWYGDYVGCFESVNIRSEEKCIGPTHMEGCTREDCLGIFYAKPGMPYCAKQSLLAGCLLNRKAYIGLIKNADYFKRLEGIK